MPIPEKMRSSWSTRRIDDPLASFAGRTDLAMVLGSGLGELSRYSVLHRKINYEDIPFFQKPTVQGHPGFLAFSSFGERNVLLFAGRIHLYEGYDNESPFRMVSLASALGCSSIVLTNAAGSLTEELPEGSLVLVRDLIALPFRARIGSQGPRIGIERCCREELLSKNLRDAIATVAKEVGVELREGVLAWVPGPSYETSAEASALKVLGADAVTMSVLPEALAAQRLGLNCAVLSLVTNFTSNVKRGRIEHEDILRRGKETCRKVAKIIMRLPSSRRIPRKIFLP